MPVLVGIRSRVGASVLDQIGGVVAPAIDPDELDEYTDGVNLRFQTHSEFGAWAQLGNYGSLVVVNPSSDVTAYARSNGGFRAAAVAGSGSEAAYTARFRYRSTANEMAVVFSEVNPSQNYYRFMANAAQTQWVLERVDSETPTTIAAAVSISPAVSADDERELTLEVSGGTVRGLVDGVEVMSASDSTYTSGIFGVIGYGSAAAGTGVTLEAFGPFSSGVSASTWAISGSAITQSPSASSAPTVSGSSITG